MSSKMYVHGYSEREEARLRDQAGALTDLLHHDTKYSKGETVLEAGCGVGAQTVILARNSPEARFTSVDISAESLGQAEEKVTSQGFTNVIFQVQDINNLSFPDEVYDHVFVCFVLEHLPDPGLALMELKRVLRPGGTITIIEGDHGSAYFHPDSDAARRTIQCLIDLQAASGGDSLVGRRLYPLITEAGFLDVSVSPRMVYVDSSRPELVKGFTRNTFTAMVEGVKKQAIEENLIDEATWEEGIQALHHTAEENGTFCYTFFKAVGIKSR
ncbi:methyltransferase domain-containing protein [bacterium]|nr:MAG: methyltransferase domain-containing protein [bacterium]